MSHAFSLAILAAHYPVIKVGKNVQSEILGLCRDNLTFQAGFVFVAIEGNSWDGHSFVKEACEKGAAAIFLKNKIEIPKEYSGFVFLVDDTRKVFDELANLYFALPTEKMICIGITGTNGKTTTSYLIEHILNFAQISTGVIGTIDHHLKNKIWHTQLTTPGPMELYGRLNEMQKRGAQAVVMECSSHALHQKRLESVEVDVAIFTNLTRDHLDYHKSVENYFAAKNLLFSDLLKKSHKKNKVAVINVDDSYALQISAPDGVNKILYGQSAQANFHFQIFKMDFSGVNFQLTVQGKKFDVFVPMVGIHNVYNACAALACVHGLKMDLPKAIDSLKTFVGVPGRLQAVPNVKMLHIFVDYAHTDDALKNVLQFLMQIRDQQKQQVKIITVFGAGGDRDRGKRPLMAQVAEKFSDQVIVTSDNPRFEEPEEIIEEILAGVSAEIINKKFLKIIDRKSAIAQALNMANAGDVVLIAGKGHENYQESKGKRTDFSDVDVVQELLNSSAKKL